VGSFRLILALALIVPACAVVGVLSTLRNEALPIADAGEKELAKSEPRAESGLPKLPETTPPPGLPIITWGPRDLFPVIRNPEYWTAEQGDAALAPDEPVLALVINGEARAYSTNQLNEHEMVVDTLAGTPILVTY